MDYILEITTIIVAIGSLIANVVFSLIMARKNKYAEISTAHRIENLNKIIALTEKLMFLSSADYLKHGDKNEIARNFIETREAIIHYYLGTYAEEKELVNDVKSLSDAWFNYLENQSEENLQALNSARYKLSILAKVNEVAYWRFIRDHYNLSLHSGVEFSYFYDKTRKQYFNDGFPIEENPKK